MFYLIATLEAQPEHRETLAAAAKKLVAASSQEEGCISHDCLISVADPNRFVFVERWETREAMDAHGTQPHVQEWRALSRPLWTGPSKVEIITPAEIFHR